MSTIEVPSRQLGRNGPIVSALGFGAMGIGAFYGKTDKDEAFKALTHAADCGMTFWDCADIYGGTEAALGNWFNRTGRRNEIFLATKFGARDPTKAIHDSSLSSPNSKPSYIREALKRSLEKLGGDYIDLYYQHRVDPNVPIEIVLETLREFVDNGKVKWIGLSECSIDTMRRAKAVPGIGEKVIAAQMEFSPFCLDIIKSGFLQAARELGVTIVAYSPLGKGMISGRYRCRSDFDADDIRLLFPRFSEENFSRNLILADSVKAISEKYNATPSQITLSWIMSAYPDFIPIPGCRTVERVQENAGSVSVALTDDDIEDISKLSEDADVGGERLPSNLLTNVRGDCLLLGDWNGE
ncbi:Aldo/keto reductase [Rickenella mellea]|uniref:Aldo/keto reductase n=1 Tax=Rickenella mellea TaxID=50990 RepID=A0A4Y7PHS9_9AGAM|nr:Aldo/keto reductase [Rickenella mellea]